MNFLHKLLSTKMTYSAPKKDSSLRSMPVKPLPWKEPNYKGYKWGAKTGK